MDHLMADASKWKILTQTGQECWLCNHHTITLYIWTPKIGLFSMSKDEREIRYYKEKLYEKNPDYERHNVPHFASESTNWLFKQMNEVMSFVEHNDKHKPNFLNVAIKQGLLA